MGLIKIKRKLNADAAPAQAGAPAASGLLPAAAAPVQPAVACAAPQLPTAPVLTDTGAPPAKKVKILKIKSKARHAVPAVLGQPPTATPTPVFPRAPVQPAQNHSQQRPAPSRKPLSKRPLPTAVPVAGGHTVKQASGTGVEPLKKKIKLKLGTKPVKGSLNGEKKVRPLAMPPPAMISAAATIQPPLLATPQKSPVKFRILKPKIKIKTPSALNSNLSPAPAAAMKPVIKPLPQMGTPMGMKVKRKPKLEPKIQQGAQASQQVAPARIVTAVKPAAPAAPAEAKPLKEGTALYDALTAEVPEEAVVLEKNLMSMLNKLMRKDKDNTFKVEPQKGSLGSRIKSAYKATIKHPMALTTIKEAVKLPQGLKIRTWQQMSLALDLMVANCVRFNGPDNPISKAAGVIRGEFDRLREKDIEKDAVAAAHAAAGAAAGDEAMPRLRSERNEQPVVLGPRRAAREANWHREIYAPSRRGGRGGGRGGRAAHVNMRMIDHGFKRSVEVNARASYCKRTDDTSNFGAALGGWNIESGRSWWLWRPKLGHAYPKKYIPFNFCALKSAFHVGRLKGNMLARIKQHAATSIYKRRVAAASKPQPAPVGVQQQQAGAQQQQQMVAQQEQQIAAQQQQQRAAQQQQQAQQRAAQQPQHVQQQPQTQHVQQPQHVQQQPQTQHVQQPQHQQAAVAQQQVKYTALTQAGGNQQAATTSTMQAQTLQQQRVQAGAAQQQQMHLYQAHAHQGQNQQSLHTASQQQQMLHPQNSAQ